MTAKQKHRLTEALTHSPIIDDIVETIAAPMGFLSKEQVQETAELKLQQEKKIFGLLYKRKNK